ncbi:MAG: SLC13 family permease [Saprospiraceae bacterium]|nr:SLC13 family permease [Saprospiraceae bacterium]
MTVQIGLILFIVLVSLIAFIWDKIAPEIIALSVLAILMVSGILNPIEGLSGFSNPATITILLLFFVGRALKDVGLIRTVGDVLLNITNQSLAVNVFFIILIAGVSSAFINTTAVVIVFMPIVLRMAKIRNISPSLLLMPLSFGAIIGGASTTIGTSTNLLISDIASSHGSRALNVFEFSGIGIVLFSIVAVYMIFSATFVLRSTKRKDNLIDDYNLREYFAEFIVTPKSDWIGKKVDEIPVLKSLEINILTISRNGHDIVVPRREEIIEVGDDLLVRINRKNLMMLQEVKGLEISGQRTWKDEDLEKFGVTLMELMVNKNSSLIGQDIEASEFRVRYRGNILGVLGSDNRLTHKRLRDIRFSFGDTLLIETAENRRYHFYENDEFIVLNEWKRPHFKENKQWIALLCIVGIVVLAATGVLPILLSAMAGSVILLLTKCLDINSAYRSVEWKVIFMLAGLIPLGLAMEKTGTSTFLSDLISNALVGFPKYWALFLLYMIVTLITSVIYNNATAVILAPIVIALAPALNMEVIPLLGLLMFAANCCYLTPIGYQTNLLIYSPGQYSFRDFFIVGLPLCIILGLVSAYLFANY